MLNQRRLYAVALFSLSPNLNKQLLSNIDILHVKFNAKKSPKSWVDKISQFLPKQIVQHFLLRQIFERLNEIQTFLANESAHKNLVHPRNNFRGYLSSVYKLLVAFMNQNVQPVWPPTQTYQ